jgi:ribosomal protein S18 acetylase RimI-like enzyme
MSPAHPAVEIRPLRAEELTDAGRVAARALSTSPTSYWVSGDDAVARVHLSLDVFVDFVEGQTAPIGAFLGTHVVGVCGVRPPGECIGATTSDEMRVFPQTLGPAGDVSRGMYVWALLCAHDLDERHWHLGPVAVEPVLQGVGIGGLMLRAFAEQMDDQGEVAWLETDKPENVVFYRRARFEVVEELTEHGLTNWWMRRDPG